MAKTLQFQKRLNGLVFYKDLESNTTVSLIEEESKAFLIKNVEGYTTPYPPGIQEPPTVNPYKITVSPYKEDKSILEGNVFYRKQKIATVYEDATYTAFIEGTKFKGKVALEKRLEQRSQSTGFFVQSILFPAFTPQPTENPDDAVTKSIESLQKLGESLTATAAALLPSENDIIDDFATKDPSIAMTTKLIRQEQAENEESGMSKEEAKSKADEEEKKMIDDFKKSIKDFVKTELNKIKDNIGVFTTAVTNIQIDVPNALAQVLLPPAIGVPPVIPNPPAVFLQLKAIKNSLSVTLNVAVVAFGAIMASALLLKIEIPQPLIASYTILLTLNSLINTIPG